MRQRNKTVKIMANWTDILQEINTETESRQRAVGCVLDDVRRRHVKALHEYTHRNIIAYYSAFLSKPQARGVSVEDDDKNAFMNCIHEMDRTKGLDLILHTPGGDIAATESLVYYLRQIFGKDVRAIVPQLAMSAGTMIACSCKEIILGKQSNIGPIDPQINGIPADVVVLEFGRAYKEIKDDPAKAHVWAPILNRYPPSFVMQCENAVEWAKGFVTKVLAENMFADANEPKRKAQDVASRLSSSTLNKNHSKHLHFEECQNYGLNVVPLENDQQLQELVLAVHHAYTHTTTNTAAIKIVENQFGRALVRNAPRNASPQGISIDFGAGQQ